MMATRFFLAGFPLVALGLVAGSCVDVLGIEYNDSAAELCELLNRCYDDGRFEGCAERVGDNLDASPDRARSFLAAYADGGCDSDCSAARRCLDLAPACEGLEERCGSKEECCRFTKGLADCQDEQCCSPVGVNCDVNEQCCNGDCKPLSDAGGATYCGGVKCGVQDEPCEVNSDCCTYVCQANGKCSGEICPALGSPCDTEAECCEGHICDENRCNIPVECSQSGEPCPDGSECCDGLECTANAGNGPVCSDCGGQGETCNNTENCCSGSCVGNVCVEEPCAVFGAACSPEVDCCGSLTCQYDFCNACPTSVACDDQNSPCSDGPGLDASTCDPVVALVCEIDPGCCCNKWDSLCIQQYTLMGGACPT